MIGKLLEYYTMDGRTVRTFCICLLPTWMDHYGFLTDEGKLVYGNEYHIKWIT